MRRCPSCSRPTNGVCLPCIRKAFPHPADRLAYGLALIQRLLNPDLRVSRETSHPPMP